MARMYARRKGKSGSTKPIHKTKPSFVAYDEKTTEQLVVKLAKAGNSTSKIGLILRDTYGIPDVKIITKKKMNAILKEHKVQPELPEDLTALIKKDIAIIKHFENNKKDMSGKRSLQLTESKIRRLVKYYKRTGALAPGWTYDRSKAKLLIE